MEGLAQGLAEAGYRAVRINFRGAGKSTGPGAGITLHTLAADVAGVIKALNIGSANVSGHAFGNRGARVLAADHPELVRSVILFAAGCKVPPNPPAEAALFKFFNPASLDAEVLDSVKYFVCKSEDIATTWQILKPCRAPVAEGMQVPAGEITPLKDWWAPAGQQKYLVVQGTDDQIAPPENWRIA